ncbi:MAG: hypothetical protein ACYSW3_30735, partial [Planctomycetota bacterium]
FIMIMKARNPKLCPRCRRIMIHEFDRDVYRCIGCAKVWPSFELASLGYVYSTSKTIKQLMGF